ncbi:hypothetical protein THAOC_25304, partial [Thalassiosira oceanica]
GSGRRLSPEDGVLSPPQPPPRRTAGRGASRRRRMTPRRPGLDQVRVDPQPLSGDAEDGVLSTHRPSGPAGEPPAVPRRRPNARTGRIRSSHVNLEGGRDAMEEAVGMECACGAAKRQKFSSLESLDALASIDILGHLATFLEPSELCQTSRGGPAPQAGTESPLWGSSASNLPDSSIQILVVLLHVINMGTRTRRIRRQDGRRGARGTRGMASRGPHTVAQAREPIAYDTSVLRRRRSGRVGPSRVAGAHEARPRASLLSTHWPSGPAGEPPTVPRRRPDARRPGGSGPRRSIDPCRVHGRLY